MKKNSVSCVLVILAKIPHIGKVKTRLGQTIGLAQAARLSRQFIRQTCQWAQGLPGVQKKVAFTPQEGREEMAACVPVGFELFPQSEGNLGNRLAHIFQHCFSRKASRVVVIGADTPHLPPQWIERAFSLLRCCDVVIGPSSDGGYCLIGLSQPAHALFKGVHWSSQKVLVQTLRRISRQGLSCHFLPYWYDVDDLKTFQLLKLQWF